MERILMIAMCIYSGYMVFSIIFRWKRFRERVMMSKKGTYNWLEKKCGELAARIIVGVLFAAIIVCFGMAFISGEV